MPLADVQSCLISLARGDQSPLMRTHDLSDEERGWLRQLQGSKGLMVTEQIQSWWRLGRLHTAAPFTVGLLKYWQQEFLIIDYITHMPLRTLFFAAEIEQFKQFLFNRDDVDAFTKTTIAFECALKQVAQLQCDHSVQPISSITKTDTIQLAPGVVVLKFSRNPLEVFHALLTAKPIAAGKTENFYVVVAPRLPDLWRRASTAEYLLMSQERYLPESFAQGSNRPLVEWLIREGILQQ